MSTDAAQPAAQWVFLVDPAWRPEQGEPVPTPPPRVVVGAWHVDEDGAVGRFEPNPDYEPATPRSPTDPLDAALRMANSGEVDTDALFAVMRATVFGVALDADDRPLIAPAPDEVPSLLVTTAPAHRGRVAAAGWQEQTVADVAALLAEHDVDALLNPGAPTSTRLLAATFDRAAAD